jgi:hypothetical protein
MRHATVLLALVLTGLGLSAAPASADSATPTPSSSPSTGAAATTPDPNRVTFGIQPASPNKDGAIVPDQRPYLYYVGAPGATITDHVALVNYGVKPVVATVYSADARNDKTGGFTLLTGQEKSTDAGAWTSLSTKRLTLTIAGRTTNAQRQEAYGYAVVPVTIKIPATASPGDHVGALLVSVMSAGSAAQGPNVQLDQRVGTRMFIRVAGALEPRILIENVTATYNGTLNPVGQGSATVSFTVANRGNVKLGGRIKVDVSGLLGRSASIDLPDLQLLLPGNSVDLSATVPGVPPQLRNTATVTLTPLKLSADADPALPDVTASTSFWAIAWTLIGLLLLLLLLGGYTWYRRHRRPSVEDVGGAHAQTPVPVG